MSNAHKYLKYKLKLNKFQNLHIFQINKTRFASLLYITDFKCLNL